MWSSETPNGLIQASDGNFYGTTLEGGNLNGICGSGCGTIFKITPSGKFAVLYSFCALTFCTDGAQPRPGLVQATDGNFYGTTLIGGANGPGTVFRLTPNGVFTTLYSFCSQPNCTDGAQPGGLMQATDGNFYGTTADGGSTTACHDTGGCGTVFRITPQRSLTTLHSFDATDGALPVGVPTQSTSGTFYGTTNGGFFNEGTVFSLGVGLGPFVEALPSTSEEGCTVKILGTDLTGASSVTFNDTPAAFRVASPTLIVTTVPSGATTGPVKVTTPERILVSNVAFRVR